MKSNRGITIVSLLIYIIVLTIVIGAISTMTGFFYKNANKTLIASNRSDDYTRFTTFLSEDINSRKNRQNNR